jgi:hypothetical protein
MCRAGLETVAVLQVPSLRRPLDNMWKTRPPWGAPHPFGWGDGPSPTEAKRGRGPSVLRSTRAATTLTQGVSSRVEWLDACA